MGDYEVRYRCGVGRTGRMLVARLLPGTDLVGGIMKLCQDHDIQAGIITSVMGTLQKATVYTAAPRPDLKGGIGYSDPLLVAGPIEFITGQGLLSVLESGELFLHLHGLISDLQMKIYGGHFSPSGNPVLSTIDVAITETVGVKVPRVFDPETELVLNAPYTVETE
ncbi:MAG: PPC domain-containing DNA-binding protein [Chloroflexota bacterium]